jgi:magnesium transporter
VSGDAGVGEAWMLSAYVPQGCTLERRVVEPGGELPESAVWIDLINPTPGEDKLVERFTGVAIPTREEMQEIEVSSRLYVENHARYMTATLMCQSDTATPRTTAVTFILVGHRLVTVRYDEPKPFTIVEHKLNRVCPPNVNGETVLMDLFDAVIDRSADILEKIGAEVDQVSHDIFEPDPARRDRARTADSILIAIGRKGDLTSKVRESLLSIGRLLLFLANEAEGMRWQKEVRAQLKTMQRDVASLSDHSTYLSNKITFLLDALLGVVSIQQNQIIKLFSVMAVVLMPPTLVASIYGMNFKWMPELEWHLGYPMALLLMLFAGALPYVFFKWKKWL